jgi:hypothetical protein
VIPVNEAVLVAQHLSLFFPSLVTQPINILDARAPPLYGFQLQAVIFWRHDLLLPPASENGGYFNVHSWMLGSRSLDDSFVVRNIKYVQGFDYEVRPFLTTLCSNPHGGASTCGLYSSSRDRDHSLRCLHFGVRGIFRPELN